MTAYDDGEQMLHPPSPALPVMHQGLSTDHLTDLIFQVWKEIRHGG